MKSKVSMMKTVIAAVVLAAMSGIARADDSSLNPFSGDSYAYFNGGNLGRIANPRVISDAPSTWRQSNPNGLTYRDFAALGSEATANRFHPPVFSAAAAEPTWRASHPNGTTDAEFAALGSQKIATRSPPRQPATRVSASPNRPADAVSASR